MPPKAQEINMPWAVAKEVCSPSEMERLACLGVAFLNSGVVDKSIYQAAADQFGGDIKPDSYKRSIWVISTKVKKAADGGVSAVKPKPGKKPARKRKTPASDDDDDDEEFDLPSKGAKVRKTSSPSPDAVSETQFTVKDESDEDKSG